MIEATVPNSQGNTDSGARWKVIESQKNTHYPENSTLSKQKCLQLCLSIEAVSLIGRLWKIVPDCRRCNSECTCSRFRKLAKRYCKSWSVSCGTKLPTGRVAGELFREIRRLTAQARDARLPSCTRSALSLGASEVWHDALTHVISGATSLWCAGLDSVCAAVGRYLTVIYHREGGSFMLLWVMVAGANVAPANSLACSTIVSRLDHQ